jgi:Mrp family chromosome partitioning ATPase
MSKIYEALRRHDKTAQPTFTGNVLGPTRGPIVQALDSIHPIVSRLAKEAGHGVVLHFVAATVGEGVSTLSSEFALIASRVKDSHVLLLDADKVQLTTANQFGCDTDVGILDVLLAGKPIDADLVPVADREGLRVGVLAGQRSPPLSRKAMPALYQQLRSKYEVTVIDCPAIFSERYMELSPEAADGIVLVVQAERNRPEILRRAQSLVEDAGGKFLGAILNRRHTYIPDAVYRLL